MRRALFTTTFWLDTAQQTVKDAAKGVLLALGASDAGPFNALNADLVTAGGFGLGAAIISVLISVSTAKGR